MTPSPAADPDNNNSSAEAATTMPVTENPAAMSIDPAPTPTTGTAAASGDDTPSQQQSGINIHLALDILSDRTGCTGGGGDGDGHSHSATHGCHAHQTEELKSMGQTIDLFGSGDSKDKEATGIPETAEEVEAMQKEQEERRQERVKEMKAKLESMSVQELLQTVMETQQQRVETYQGYNKSLTTILQSGNMTSYIGSCAHTTAHFAVLSETIIHIRSTLATKHNRKDLEQLLNNLQKHEKEKLNLTAALHLERIRERNENMNIGSVENADDRIRKLLTQGVQSLNQKVDVVVEDINETMEEIRFALLEERADEDDEQE